LPLVSKNPVRNSSIQLVACCLFFASGALGLGYQLVWVKKAALIVGGSQIALSTIVTSFFLGLARATGMTAAQGALPQLRAATDPEALGGEFYAPRFMNFGPPVRTPVLRRIGLDAAIATLWEVSERETGVALEVSAA